MTNSILTKLVELGEKKVGTHNNSMAMDIIEDQLRINIPEISISREQFQARSVTSSKPIIEYGTNNIEGILYDQTGIKNNCVIGKIYYAGKLLSSRKAKNVVGKIAVFDYSIIAHRVKQIKSSFAAGALGVIIVSRFDDMIQAGVGVDGRDEMCPIPAIGITKRQWAEIQSAKTKTLTIKYSATEIFLESNNIIGDFTTNPLTPRKIVIGAHFDSWFCGAQDNCVAVALACSIAEEIKKLSSIHSYKTNFRFIFWNAEEIGMQGSKYHVAHNSEVENYISYINLEMPVPTKGNKLNTILYSDHQIIKESISFFSSFKIGYLALPFNLVYKVTRTFPSDVDHFYKKHIPCITTFCNNSFYHTHSDKIDNIVMEKYDLIKKQLVEIILKIDNAHTIQ